MASGVDQLREKHRQFWHDYYPKSFISIPDPRLESFYWIQLYKMASGTRENKPVLDLLGPWFKPTNWSCIWWNLNVQLTYWPMSASNHLELGEPLYRLLDKSTVALIENAPEKWRYDSAYLGNPTGYDLRNDRMLIEDGGIDLICLPWTVHNYWLHYRHSMDDQRLRTKLFPLMKRAWNLYLHVLTKKKDGKYHLPRCYSSEYGCAEDTNQDLAIIRWGCQTLLDICQRLKLDDPMIPRWQETLKNLVEFQTKDGVLMIGKDVPLAKAQRCYSHLYGIYPFRVLTADQGPEVADLMRKSVAHYLSFPEDRSGLNGYSYTGPSSMMSYLGDGDEALRYLNKLLDLSPVVCNARINSNTMYTEMGAASLADDRDPAFRRPEPLRHVIAEWGRDNPSLPGDSRNLARYHHPQFADGRCLSCQCGPARRRHPLRSHPEPCGGALSRALRSGQEPHVGGDRNFRVERAADGVFSVDLRKSETVILRRADDDRDLVVSAVKANKDICNYFGVKK